MRILILGAGALGGYFGARLLAAGRDVTFLVRPARAAALAAKGLTVLSAHAGDVHVEAPPTVAKPERAYDLVMLGPKAYDLESAMEAVAPAVGPGTAVLPLLNGMAHLPKLDARFGAEKVLGGTCLISATLDAEGTIRHLNNRDFLFWGERAMPHPKLAAITEALTNAKFEGQQRANITQDMWEKWTFLAALAASTCMLRANLGEIEEAGAAPLVLELFAECTAIAAAEGYQPSDDYILRNQRFLTTPGSTMEASMLRDLEAGARIEEHQIVGDLLEHGAQRRIATPLLRVAHAHLKAYEVRRKRPTA